MGVEIPLALVGNIGAYYGSPKSAVAHPLCTRSRNLPFGIPIEGCFYAVLVGFDRFSPCNHFTDCVIN